MVLDDIRPYLFSLRMHRKRDISVSGKGKTKIMSRVYREINQLLTNCTSNIFRTIYELLRKFGDLRDIR